MTDSAHPPAEQHTPAGEQPPAELTPAEQPPAEQHPPAREQPWAELAPAEHSPAEQQSPAHPPAEQTECSRAGCREVAVWAIRWRNPRIHAADRRKTWVACAEHVVYLREFLSARDFPVEVAALVATRA